MFEQHIKKGRKLTEDYEESVRHAPCCCNKLQHSAHSCCLISRCYILVSCLGQCAG